MPISMQESARYVTQQSIWDNHVKGALTNRQITKYAKAGRYGEEHKNQRKERTKRTRQGSVLNLKQLLA